MSRVVVTGARREAGQALGLVLAAEGHDVVPADVPDAAGPRAGTDAGVAKGTAPGIAPLPPVSDPAYASALFSLAAQVDAELIVPTRPEELTLPALHGAPDGIGVALPPFPAALAAGDTWLTYALLRRAGVPVPHSCLPGPGTLPRPAFAAPLEPYVSKPRREQAGFGATVHHAGQEPHALPAGFVLQEYVPGAGYVVQLFLSPHGLDPLALAFEAPGPGPQGFVASDDGQPDDEAGDLRPLPDGAAPAIADLALRAAAMLGLAGPAEVAIRLRADGAPTVVDVWAQAGARVAHAPEIARAIVASYASVPAAWDLPA